MRWSDIIIQIVWGFILLCPIIPLDADAFVTPWFGPRLFSLIIFIPVFIIGSILLATIVVPLTLILGSIGLVLILLYEGIDVLAAGITCTTSSLSFFASCLSLLGILAAWIPTYGGSIAAVITAIVGFVNSVLDVCGTVGSMLGALGFIIPVFLVPVVLLILLPLLILVGGILALGVVYFFFYILQIMLGVACMVVSLPLQAVFSALLAVFGEIPVIGTLIGLCNTFTTFYAFCIPPNFIEVITQGMPLCVNVLASLPSVISLPISLATTVWDEVSSLISAMPSMPEYMLTLGNRVIFSGIAECIAIVSLIIDTIAAIVLALFAITTSFLFECLTLDIIESMPQIAVLTLALVFVTCASMLDVCGVLVLRTPDMIEEYAYSVLKSAAMIPVLSAIIPSIPATPAMLQPEVVIEGLSMIAMGILLLPCAIPGALMVLVYNIAVRVLRTIYSISPRIVTLPIDLTRRCLSSVNNVCSGIASILEGATEQIEANVVPY